MQLLLKQTLKRGWNENTLENPRGQTLQKTVSRCFPFLKCSAVGFPAFPHKNSDAMKFAVSGYGTERHKYLSRLNPTTFSYSL